MNLKSILFLILLCVTKLSTSQVTMFEPTLISNDEAFGITFSPDGKELYFVASFGGRDTLQIFQSKKVDDQWQKPELAFFADTKFLQIDPSISPDGNTILFNVLKDKGKSFDIYQISRTDSGWGEVQLMSEAVNSSASDFYATMSLKKNIYFVRRIESNDIYVSYFLNNEYQKAMPLSNSINTPKSESNPYISPNEDYLIFFSDREGGFGDTDLYISFRKNESWSKPINLGNKVNTEIAEFCPTMDIKNGYFYFSRTQEIEKKRKENIYRIKLKELQINKLKKSALF